MWSEVYREMKHAPPMTNAAYKIRESYERYSPPPVPNTTGRRVANCICSASATNTSLLAVYEEELGLPSEYDMAIPAVVRTTHSPLPSLSAVLTNVLLGVGKADAGPRRRPRPGHDCQRAARTSTAAARKHAVRAVRVRRRCPR